MNVLLLALAVAHGSAPTAPDPCRGQLDAAVVESARCQSPAWASAAVAADVVPEPPPLLRDPKLFASELGFVSSMFAIAGGALIAVAAAQDPNRLSADEVAVKEGVFVGGVSALTLSGLVGAAALSMWVFDPSTAKLRLPIFEGEDR